MSRPTFTYKGIKCHKIAELSTSNPHSLIAVLDIFERLSVPIDCLPNHMVISGISPCLTYFIYAKVCPMGGASDVTFVGKRKEPPPASSDEEDEDGPAVAEDGMDVFRDDSQDTPVAGEAAASSVSDFYRLYDAGPQRFQVDMSSLTAMLRAARKATVLSLIVYSHSPCGDADRLMVNFKDAMASTQACVLLQDITAESVALKPIETTFAVTMPALEFGAW
jgi:hypothetical protein